MDLNGLTLTQRKMVAILQDQLPHTALELHACLRDKDTYIDNIRSHITFIRKLLRKGGVDVLCSRGVKGEPSSATYQLVRLTASPYNE